VGVVGDVTERLAGGGGEGVDDRGRAGDAEPVEAAAQVPDRVQVVGRQAAFAVEDDHRRHLFGVGVGGGRRYATAGGGVRARFVGRRARAAAAGVRSARRPAGADFPVGAPRAADRRRAVEDFDRLDRFRPLRQKARLAGGGDLADVGAGEEAADPDRDPDGDRDPAPARAGHRGSERGDHRRRRSASCTRES